MSEAQPVKSRSKFEQLLAGQLSAAAPKPEAASGSRPGGSASSPVLPEPVVSASSPVGVGGKPVWGGNSSIESIRPIPPTTSSSPAWTAANGKSKTQLRSALSALSIDERHRPTAQDRSRLFWPWMLLAVLVGVGLTLVVVYPHLHQTAVGSATGPVAGASPAAGGGGEPASHSAPAQTPGMPVYEGSGKIVSDRKVNVATKVSGQIVEMLVEQGDRIKAGDVIARIEDVIYKAAYDQAKGQLDGTKSELARAEAQLLRGQADKKRAAVEVQRAAHTVESAQGKVEQLQAQLVFLDWNAERVNKLAGTKMAGEVESHSSQSLKEAQKKAILAAQADVEAGKKAVLTAQASQAVIEADLSASQADVSRAKAGVEAAEAFFRQQAKRYQDCTVVAPIGGVILERNAQVGDFVAAEGGFGGNANSKFVTIADTERLRVEVDVNEKDIKLLNTGMPCRISAAADPAKNYDGYIMWIDPGANYDKAQVQVKVRILKPDDILKIEGAANVQFGVGAASGPATQPASRP